MSIRFLADANLDHATEGIRRREPSIDIKSANEAGLEGLSDDKVLELAAGEGRVLVSHDKLTMPAYFAARIWSGESGGAAGYTERVCRRGRRIASDGLVRFTRGGVD